MVNSLEFDISMPILRSTLKTVCVNFFFYFGECSSVGFVLLVNGFALKLLQGMSFCFPLWKQCFVVNPNDAGHMISWGFCFKMFVIDAAACWCIPQL